MGNRLARASILLLILGAGLSGALAATAKKAVKPTKPTKPAKVAKPAPTEVGVWKVRLIPDPDAAARGEKESDDTLVLRRGLFHSTGCDAFGFPATPYKADGDLFVCDALSPKDGKLHWHGEVSGADVSGQMVWTKPDGVVLRYRFEGRRSDAPAPASSPQSQSQAAGKENLRN